MDPIPSPGGRPSGPVRRRSRRLGRMHLLRRATAAALLVLGIAAVSGCTTAPVQPTPPPAPTGSSPAVPPDAAEPGPYRVASVDYDLGDRAFSLPWFHGFGSDGFPDPAIRAPLELAATVHYPIDHTATRHPLVEIQHGLWYTCADRSVDSDLDRATRELARLPVGKPSAGTKPEPDPRAAKWEAVQARAIERLSGWPCRRGVAPLPSYRGYDYLGTYLASHGIIAVSIGENGVNSGDIYAADRARAAVAVRHLAMWAQLDRTGGGPLAGRFVAAGTRAPVQVSFRNRLDLTRVGLVGHSRGGRGVMWQSADDHRDDLPSGVRIAAVVTLAAAAITNIPAGDPAQQQYLTTRIPVLAWAGTCDGAVADAGDYLTRMARRPHASLTLVTVHGANHDFLNTQWSPAGGQVGGSDDAPSRCHPDTGTATSGATAVLTESQERLAATTYAGAFLLQHLVQDDRFADILTGRAAPLARTITVDVLATPASSG